MNLINTEEWHSISSTPGSVVDLYWNTKPTLRRNAMSAKYVEDLPSDAEIIIDHNGNEFSVYLRSREASGVVSAAKNQSQIGHKYPDVYEITYSSVSHGWGPLLYDIAMEWATEHGDGLTSDKVGGSSPDATGVWEFYHGARDDIDRIAIDAPGYDFQNSVLDFIYAKEPYVISELSEKGFLGDSLSVERDLEKEMGGGLVEDKDRFSRLEDELVAMYGDEEWN